MIEVSDIEHLSEAKKLKSVLEKRAESEESLAYTLAAQSLDHHIEECFESEKLNDHIEECFESEKLNARFNDSLRDLAEDIINHYPELADLLIRIRQGDEGKSESGEN